MLALHGTNGAAQVKRLLTVPMKRFARPLLGALSPAEGEALLAAPNDSTLACRRDRFLFQLLYDTGPRISQNIHLRVEDLSIHDHHAVQRRGTGRQPASGAIMKSHRTLGLPVGVHQGLPRETPADVASHLPYPNSTTLGNAAGSHTATGFLISQS